MAEKVFLLPCELYVSKEPAEIATLLGSCVGICLYNKKFSFGGMNHYMLASAHPGEAPSGKFGDYSTEMLIKMMLSHDNDVKNIDATVLGGGNVTGHLGVGAGIGAGNIIIARDMLAKYNIRVIAKHIGGDHGRKIHFKNWTGEIDVQKIEKSEQTKVIEEKRKDLKGRKIKVLVVDDSKTVRNIITSGISQDPDIEIAGEAADPYEAREILLEKDPDVICLDIIMPKMDGITFLKKLFLYKPKPVIIISTVAQAGSKLRDQAERIGAVDVIDKEDLKLYSDKNLVESVLTNKIKAAANVFVAKKSKEDLEKI